MGRKRFVFSGSGGQGVITAAIVLAKAAVLFENKNAVQSQIYGASARGGATRSDVLISDEEIYFPKVLQPNTLVSLTQESYNAFADIIRPGGLLLVDSRFVTPGRKVAARQISLPMYDSVMEKMKRPIVFNICMLGTLIGLTQIVQAESVIKVLETTVPKEFMAMNSDALALGMELGVEYRKANPIQ